MFTLPYRTLMHYKRWATNGLNAVTAENFDGIAADERILVLRLLDHIQAVDEIFSHNLEVLAGKARATADWYADYADALLPEEGDEPIAFSFANGEPARMTRREMLLHVAMHAAGHRGQAALLLQKNGIQPWPDRMTDFLKAEAAGPQRQVPLAEAAAR